MNRRISRLLSTEVRNVLRRTTVLTWMVPSEWSIQVSTKCKLLQEQYYLYSFYPPVFLFSHRCAFVCQATRNVIIILITSILLKRTSVVFNLIGGQYSSANHINECKCSIVLEWYGMQASNFSVFAIINVLKCVLLKT